MIIRLMVKPSPVHGMGCFNRGSLIHRGDLIVASVMPIQTPTDPDLLARCFPWAGPNTKCIVLSELTYCNTSPFENGNNLEVYWIDKEARTKTFRATMDIWTGDELFLKYKKD